MTSFDPVRFKQGQAEMWSAAATGWRTWWERIEPLLQPVSKRLLILAKVAPGMCVLDAGTGIGEPALTAAHLVGPGGSVVACDIAPAMIEIARERAAAAGTSNVDFEVADVGALDHPDASFDAIVSRHTLMFVPEPDAALARLRRMLRPGGFIAASVIGGQQDNSWLAIPMGAAREVFDLPPPDPAAPTPFSFSDPGVLGELFSDAGFLEVAIEEMPLSVDLDSPEQFLQFQLDVNAPLRSLFADAPTENSARVRALILERLQPFTLANGSIRLPGRANIVSAHI